MYFERAKALKRFYAMGIVLLMALSTVSIFTVTGSNDEENYLVSLNEGTSAEVFSMIGAKALVDYGNGLYVTQSTESQAAAMRHFGSVVKVENTIDLYPSDVTLDSSKGPEETPSLTREYEWDRETYIVQFVGPYKPEWLEAIEKEEGRIGKIAPTYSVVVKMSPLVKSRVSQLPYVQWVGAYQPFHKISDELLESEGGQRIAVNVFEDSQTSVVSRRLVDVGASVLMSYPPKTIIAYVDSGLLPWIVSLPDVLDVRRDFVSKPMDLMSGKIHGAFESRSVLRSGLPSSLTGQSPGPDGIEGTADDYFEVVGLQDTGVDICDPDIGHPDLFKGPHGDRVIRIEDRTGYSCPDGYITGLSHGTYVVGGLIGNGFAWEYNFGESTDDDNWEHSEAVGIVPEGKLSLDGIQSSGMILLANPSYWEDQYADGAHIYVNAFATAPADYGSFSWAVDNRTNANNSRLMIFAAGNEGPNLNTLTSSSQGKNGLTSGATLNFRPNRANAHNPDIVADFSGRGGPLQSYGRLKPDLVTVGTQAVGLLGLGEWQYNDLTGKGNPQDDCIMQVDVYNHTDPDNLTGDGICDYRYYEFGTSVSTPNLGGLAMLVREYLREVEGIDDPHKINSQLVKALMINGATRMDESIFDYPGYEQGWGRVDLVQSLFPPAPRTNRYEEGVMTTTGVWNPSFGMTVQTDEVPLKVTLVWVDTAGKALNRDLNLKVISPSGDVFHGNVYGTTGAYDGWSIPNPLPSDSNPVWDRIGNDTWDDVNNVEQVEVQFPESGTWVIEVTGFAIPSDTPFALVAGSDFGPQEEFRVELSAQHSRVLEVAQGGDVPFPFTVTNFGTVVDDIYLSAPAFPDLAFNFESELLTDVKPREKINTYVIISASGDAVCGVHDLTIGATSLLGSVTDQLDLSLVVKCDKSPIRLQVTNTTSDEMEPSILTFNDGTTDHIFISYRKTTRVAPDDRFGGENVWVAHATLDDEGMPITPFAHTEVSNWNDDPTDIRWTYIPQGAYQNRIMLTWTGDDPEAIDEDRDSYGVLHYSDPPYTMWNRTVIERNAGSSSMNEARVNIPLWRDDGTPDGEFIWVFEHLDYVNPDANNPTRVQTWVVKSHDGGETFGVCNLGNDPDCKRISPNDPNFYFFPNACMDSRAVLWVFFYYRLPAGNDRDLMVRLYDGAWQGDKTPLDPSDDVSLIWNTNKTNLESPTCVATSEGTSGNRMYVGVTDNLGGVNKTIWIGYLEGGYNTTNPPFSLNKTEDSGISPNLHGPEGPIGTSVSYANTGRGPVFNMGHTGDNQTWVTYVESANEFTTGNPMAASSADGFDAFRNHTILTGDPYAISHQMVDSLTVNMTHHNVYEVFHMSKGTMKEVSYDVYLLIYHQNWEIADDMIGPETDPILAFPNPFNVSALGREMTLLAGVSDLYTGSSNISAAEWKEVPLSVSDPRLIDWTDADQMQIGTSSATETAITTWTPSTWDGGETHRLCARGQDERGNWGVGSCVDVITIGKRPKPTTLNFVFDVIGWHLISLIPPGPDNTIDSVLSSIAGNYDQVRTYDEMTGEWLSYIPGKPLQTLETVDSSMAFWIHITSVPATLTLDVNVSYTTDVTLQPGWNLIGYPSTLADAVTVGQLLNDLVLNIDRIEGFDGSNSPYYLKELDPSYYIKPGEGYWMYVSGEWPVIWSVVGF